MVEQPTPPQQPEQPGPQAGPPQVPIQNVLMGAAEAFERRTMRLEYVDPDNPPLTAPALVEVLRKAAHVCHGFDQIVNTCGQAIRQARQIQQRPLGAPESRPVTPDGPHVQSPD